MPRVLLIMAMAALLSSFCSIVLADDVDSSAGGAAAEANDGSLAALFKFGSAAAIKSALDLGANVNLTSGADGLTPLMMAAAFNPDNDAVRLLLARGAQVNARESNYGLTSLMFAASFNKPVIVQILIDGGADLNMRDNWGSTALHYAAINKVNPAAAFILIKAGADTAAKDLSGRTPLMQSIVAGKPETLHVLWSATVDKEMTDEAGLGPVALAALYNENPVFISVLAQLGAKLEQRNSEGRTPFLLAAGASGVKILETLKEAGADHAACDNTGADALILASLENSRPEVINYLLATGADLNAKRTNGLTPLLAAAGNREPEIAKTLILNGADVSASEGNGRTALMLAVWLNDNEEVAKVIFNGGADPLAKDNDGHTALDYAGDNRPELVEFLSKSR